MDIGIQQLQSLQSFAEQRDVLLLEKSRLDKDVQLLKKDRENLEKANSELNRLIAEKRGRLDELDALEKYKKESISLELHNLSILKSELISTLPELQKQSDLLDKQIKEKTDQLKVFNETMDYQIKQVKGLDELVRNTVRINTNNINDLNHLVVKLKDQLIK
jgi:chromosome segregation ATPase